MTILVMRAVKPVLALVIVVTVLAGLPGVSVAQDTVPRITLALRQATLVHSMNAAACFSIGGIDADQQRARAVELADTYDTSLAAFRDGHDWLGLAPTSDPDDLDAIALAHTHWRAYRPAVDQIIAGDLHSVVMGQIMRDTGPTANDANRLAIHFLEAAPLDGISDAQRAAGQLAAEYRMLTQRALTEMCFVHFGLGRHMMRRRLGMTMDAIEASITQLKFGNARVALPPTPRVERNLRTAQLFWDKMRVTIDAVRYQDPIEDEAVVKMLKLNKSVLKQLDQAVAGYFG